jgi:hypothetical protein
MYDCLVYVAGPITADTKHKQTRNINAGIKQAARLWQKWHIPAFSPHAQSGQWEEWDQERDYIPVLAGDLQMLNRSDMMLLLPGWEESLGAQLEVGYANYLGLRVFESELALVDHVKNNYDYETLYDIAGYLPQFEPIAEKFDVDS